MDKQHSNISSCLTFDNKALRSLPIDPETSNFTRQVSGACFSLVRPDPVSNPKLISFSTSALELIGLRELAEDREALEELSEYLCGNRLFKGSQPAAHCYCGHQFGNFAGQLGDGAAMYLGEVINEKGERWEMQLKGSGKTPYSRSADGRKVLRSSLREFLCSEAMHHLNIPTTRAGSLVTSDTLIDRDIFYDGHPIMEKCSVVLRISPTFIRFGSFEICKSLDLSTQRQGPSFGNRDILVTLLNYVVETFYPQIWTKRNSNDLEDCYLEFYKEIVRLTAVMVAKWQAVGFCHGVLNTDNMSIVGVTIDYGPFGFMDRFDPSFICNASDTGGRYSYENQPSICKWNCLKLAEALKDLIPLDKSKSILESTFDAAYKNQYLTLMSMKIGLKLNESSEELITNLLETMHNTGADYTNTFLALETIVEEFGKKFQVKYESLLNQTASLYEIKKAFIPKISKEDRAFFWRLCNNNRENLIAMGGQFILDEEKKETRLEEIKNWTEQDKKTHDLETWRVWMEKYLVKLQDYWNTFESKETGCKDSLEKMQKNNPRIVLRNYLAEIAIKTAESGDFSVSQKLLEKLQNPFSNIEFHNRNELISSFKEQKINVCERPPNWACDLKVT